MGEGEGGVAYLKNRDQIIDDGMIGMQEPKTKGFLIYEILELLEMHWNCQSYYRHVILYHFESLIDLPQGVLSQEEKETERAKRATDSECAKDFEKV